MERQVPELEQGVVVLLPQRARGKGQSLGQPVGALCLTEYELEAHCD